jgi:hypothetical protein
VFQKARYHYSGFAALPRGFHRDNDLGNALSTSGIRNGPLDVQKPHVHEGCNTLLVWENFLHDNV